MNAQALYLMKGVDTYVPSSIFFCEKCRCVFKEFELADQCCRPRPAPPPKPCDYCKELVPTNGCTYAPTFHKECQIEDQMAKAATVPEASEDMFFDPYEDRFESTTEMIMDYYEADDISGTDKPEFCFGCDPDRWKLDLRPTIENMLEDYATENDYPELKDIVDLEGLQAFVDEWNKKQTIVVYHPNHKRKVRLNWEKGEADGKA